LAGWLSEMGHDALHTLDLPQGNRTSDAMVMTRADEEGRVVVTKDDDFVQSFLLHGRPARLLLVATGNIANADLEQLLVAHFPRIEAAFNDHRFVELSRDNLIVHE
jgi:predicted nuclease of predicted toxin-antitoxin system